MSKASKTQKLGRLTVGEFFARFPDDDACLSHIMEVRYGLRHICRGDHVYPGAGTIFQDSRTPLRVWFYAIYLFVTTRHGVSGKELERTLGVTYKTAWRMGQQIRSLMTKADGFEKLKGHIEVDEAYVGGYQPGRGLHTTNKTIVLGLKQRGGRLNAEVIPNIKMGTLQKALRRHVEKGATVSTDELRSYNLLKLDGYTHGNVTHSAKQYWQGDYSTNGIESFWNLFKNSVRSTHIHVSPKYMDRYLGEFTFRSNHREMSNAMFDLLISAV
jgi:transposase